MTPQMQNMMLDQLKKWKNIQLKRKMNNYLTNIQTTKMYIIHGLVDDPFRLQDIMTLLCIDKLW